MIVKAKRLGWDEVLTSTQEFDLEPLEADDYDLQGELVIKDVPQTSEHPAFKSCLVGGQEADPNTIQEQ